MGREGVLGRRLVLVGHRHRLAGGLAGSRAHQPHRLGAVFRSLRVVGEPTIGGMAILSAASSSASIATPWTALPVATGMGEAGLAVGDEGDARARPAITGTVSVPVMAATAASINAVSVTLLCPATV